nr:immunoglobulin heavy chain junction region [Macaca mulatta]MOX92691.1 immunoglobulin heavy chain junction region [Macaca mulatta]MOX94165.1 immunoglobulin heavy chain junction region [Macaca mulatta]MOX94660.1 immunoglobulin heavy chain junction region [Macaca mulatta]MOX94674.1 immunoglobulin heavy chain junction region [Macaca mulatta]
CASSYPKCSGIFCFINYGLDSW